MATFPWTEGLETLPCFYLHNINGPTIATTSSEPAPFCKCTLLDELASRGDGEGCRWNAPGETIYIETSRGKIVDNQGRLIR